MEDLNNKKKKDRYENICLDYKILLDQQCNYPSNDNNHYCNLIRLLKLDCEKWKQIKLQNINK